MAVKYFNITYRCNSSCLFCAADLGIHHKDIEEMSFDNFIESLERSSLKEGDRVILNGGEPTLHSDFTKIIRYCNERKLIIDIYSNGKTFANIDFCEEVLKDGRFYIRIPLFGEMSKHDYLTGGKENYKQTIQGIYHLVESNAYSQGRLTIEIKLLLAKCCIDENPKILDVLYKNNLLSKVSVSLNPLLISEKVKRNSDLFIDTYSNMVKKSNVLFERARTYATEIDISLLPYCVIPHEYFFEKYKKENNIKYDSVVEYSDNKMKNNKNLFRGNHKGNGKCDICIFENKCPKFPESYLSYCGEEEIKEICKETCMIIDCMYK